MAGGDAMGWTTPPVRGRLVALSRESLPVAVPFTPVHLPPPKALLVPAALGVVHFLVDASSNFVMARLLRICAPADFVLLLVAYNFLAFALQPLAGLGADWLRAPRAVMCAGLLLTAAAMLALDQTLWLPVLLTGLGNALFHVGGGTIASRATWGRASGPGLFIAPGAMGVVVGAAAGRNGSLALWPIFLALLAAAPLGARLPASGPSGPARASVPLPTGAKEILVLLLLAIAGRSLLGARVGGQLALHLGIALPLAVAAFSGKALGGLIADWVGWKRTAVPSLILSSLLLLAGQRSAWAATGGMLCFQAVTAITLAALYRILPTRVALVFGCASAALFVGSLPVLLRFDFTTFAPVPVDSLLALLTTIAVWRALALIDRLDVPVRPVPAPSAQP